MRKFLIGAVSVAALAATSVPALAQVYGAPGWGPNYGNSLEARKAMIDRRIDMGMRNGALTNSEAMRLRAQFNQILRLEANYRRNGLNSWEMSDLRTRLERLSADIRFERRDRDYGYGYDRNYDNGYGRSYDNGYYGGYRYR